MSESANTPTVVLVHGGFADASFWVPVIKDLQAHDLPVLAPPNPLRGLAHDAEYIASYASQIDGPVLLVGHSYGGAVISVAGASTPNAVGLVFVAAFALDEGESFAEIFAQFGDTPLPSAVRPGTYPLPDGETAVELTIRPELYRPAFAADLPSEETAVLAVSQRPFAAIFDDRAQAAAWKTLPSWAVVVTSDKAIPPDGERHMAKRAGAQIIEVDASHSIALSQPALRKGQHRVAFSHPADSTSISASDRESTPCSCRARGTLRGVRAAAARRHSGPPTSRRPRCGSARPPQPAARARSSAKRRPR